MHQLRDRRPRTLPFLEVPHAEVEGHQGEETKALAQILLGELTKLKLEFFWGVDALLHQESIHRIYRRAEAFLARQLLHRFIEADEFFGLQYYAR